MKKAWCNKTNKKTVNVSTIAIMNLDSSLFCSIWQIRLLFYYWVSKIFKSNVFRLGGHLLEISQSHVLTYLRWLYQSIVHSSVIINHSHDNKIQLLRGSRNNVANLSLPKSILTINMNHLHNFLLLLNLVNQLFNCW